MFSRRHPYLFFLLMMTGSSFVFILLMSLIFKVGTSDGDFADGEKVGVIEIAGMITDSRATIEHIKNYREDDAIKAIVLRIDSPGGGVGPSQEIYQEVLKTRKEKQVIVSMGSVAASGGYYIAAGADGIMANPGTITGSIGVIMGYTNFQEVLQKIGLVPIVVKSGKFKDIGSPLREMTEKERKILQGLVDRIHRQFVRDAAKGRSIDFQKMMDLADGRIFTGEEARELGLIDRLGNLEDAIAWAGKLGGIKGKINRVYPEEDGMELLRQLMNTSARTVLTNLLNPRLSAGYVYRPEDL